MGLFILIQIVFTILFIVGTIMAVFLIADLIATFFDKDIIEVIKNFWNRLRGR